MRHMSAYPSRPRVASHDPQEDAMVEAIVLLSVVAVIIGLSKWSPRRRDSD